MSIVRPFGKRGFRGQYHSRSDHHSKVICWGILFDLLQHSPLLRAHIGSGKVAFGVNHEMRDFKQQRKKNLDLVVATPGDGVGRERSFDDLALDFAIQLSPAEKSRLGSLPMIAEAPVGSVLLALEAKAAMTAYQRARPRLYDELNSSHLTVHGAADQAIAAGVAMVNIAPVFLSPILNPLGLAGPSRTPSRHKQPDDASGVVSKIKELPRRTRPGEEGFDALAILVVDCRNDGTPVTLAVSFPAPAPAEDYYYDQMIRRVASHYAYRFSHL